jgi:uncharacterized protein
MNYVFEFDQAKSDANLAKHGIDFIEAQDLWKDEGRLVFKAQNNTEPRFGLVARLGSKYWTAFWTMRGTTTRLISVRRAREVEIENYENDFS